MSKLISKLVAMTPDKYHRLTMQMSWHFRTSGLKPCPAVVVAGFHGRNPTQEEWTRCRIAVSAQRKAAKAQEIRIIAARRRATRREYMRQYMIDYRKQKGT
jgi:hypothetical protein